MREKKMRIPMKKPQARKIADELLEAFKVLFQATAVRFTNSIIGGQQVITTVNFDSTSDSCLSIVIEIVSYENSDEYHLDNVYSVIMGDRSFEITIYNSPEDYGYYSTLPDYDSGSYVFCNITEKRPDGTTLYEMSFGFDIKAKTFVELFDIDHHNLDGVVREGFDSIESLLKGRIIL